VRDGVRIHRLQLLPGLHADHARHKPAAVLIDHHRIGWRLEFLALQSRLDIDEGVGQTAFSADFDRIVVERSLVEFGAKRSSSISTFLRAGALPVNEILPVTVPAVSGSTLK